MNSKSNQPISLDLRKPKLHTMNIYLKNYLIWLGGSLALLFIMGFLNLIPYALYAVLPIIMILAGTIIGTVRTHKELGSNIQFGKAIGPVLLIIGAYAATGLIITVVRWGTDGMEFYLPFLFYNTFIQMIVGISVLLATGTWYMFEKAGKPGWAMIVPFYNIIVMLEIAKKPTWWLAMILLVPIANIVFLIMMLNGISKNFGKDAGFTVGLVFLRQIFFAILGYGDAVYLSDNPKTDESILDNV